MTSNSVKPSRFNAILLSYQRSDTFTKISITGKVCEEMYLNKRGHYLKIQLPSQAAFLSGQFSSTRVAAAILLSYH